MLIKNCSFLLKPAFIAFLLFIVTIVRSAKENCDKTQCKGPIRFYHDLKCIPIYKDANDCCAIAYDCTHLPSTRSPEKCYVNGHEYYIGEKLRDDDKSSPCDVACVCRKDFTDFASFTCAIVDCFNPPPKQGCYFKRALDTCCAGEEVCPDVTKEPIKCISDGTTYREGQYFSPRENPNLSCQCREGYRGDNIEPFCVPIGCGVEMRHAYELRQNCAPIFYESQNPNTDCNVAYRCQNASDSVILVQQQDESDTKLNEDTNPDIGIKCKYGNLTLEVGNELNQLPESNGSECLKCVCEVPPFPTCQKIPREQCNITNQQPTS